MWPAVTFHDPPGCTEACNVWPATDTTTADPTVAVVDPLISGVESFVVAVAPLENDTVGAIALIVSDWLAEPWLPAASVTVTITTYVPLAIAAAVTAQLPPCPIVVGRVWPATVTVRPDPAATSAGPTGDRRRRVRCRSR